VGGGSTQGHGKLDEPGLLAHQQVGATVDLEDGEPRWEPGTVKFADLSQPHVSAAERGQPDEPITAEFDLVADVITGPREESGKADPEDSRQKPQR
jgi:hypothetical protein